MSNDSVAAEVRAYISEKIANGEIVLVHWVTHGVIQRRSAIEGDDSEFYRVCAYKVISETAKRVIGRYEPKPQGDAELLLPGFEHLQRAYPVEREGERVLVPTDQMTNDELLARAAEYEAMAVGCRNHAKELRHFAEARQAA